MRVLASADHHFDQHRRFAECVRIHEWMVDVARRERVGLFLSGGDIYERASTPLERQAVAEWVTRMAEVCPIVISRGNHDRAFELGLLARLKTKHRILVEERAAVHVVAGAVVAAVAWPDRAALAAAAQARDGESLDAAARDALRAVFLGLRQELERHDGPRIGLGHFMIDGSVVSTGQPLLGMPLNIGLSDLSLLDVSLVIAGHIHKAQDWDCDFTRILYPGSPFRTDFGQLEEKSVALAEFNGAELASLERLATPCTRMVHFDAEWTEREPLISGLAMPRTDCESARGAECRLRYRVPAERRDAARGDAEELRGELLNEHGALSVKLEEIVIPTTRVRAPEIVSAPTLGAKLSALWDVRHDDVSDMRRTRLLGKVANLEEEMINA